MAASKASSGRSRVEEAGRCALPGQGLTHLFPGGRGLCPRPTSSWKPSGFRPSPDAPVSALDGLRNKLITSLATPEPIKNWSLASLKEKLIKIGAKVVSDGRYVAFQMAEVAIPRHMFQEILRLIAELRPQPPPAPA